LDSMMGGGVAFCRLTEFSGDSGTGKSQLLFTLAVNLPTSRGRLLFVDTAGTFRPERLYQIASLRRLNPDAVLANVEVLGARTSDKLISGAETALSSGRYSAILIDSLSDPFYGGNQLSRETSRLSLLCRRLAYFALSRGTLVAVANGVRYNPDTGSTYAQGIEHTAAYIHTRISLRRNADRWLAVDLGSHAKAEFAIGPAGIVDI
jgi:RecA/RadA recombinase